MDIVLSEDEAAALFKYRGIHLPSQTHYLFFGQAARYYHQMRVCVTKRRRVYLEALSPRGRSFVPVTGRVDSRSVPGHNLKELGCGFLLDSANAVQAR